MRPSFLLLLTAAVSLYGQALLEDFRDLRNNARGDSLWALYPSDGSGGCLVFDGIDDGTFKATVNCPTDVGSADNEFYVSFFPCDSNTACYPFPSGYAQNWIREGVWSTGYDRMNFSIRCDKGFPFSLRETFNVGTYVKNTAPVYLSERQSQGWHYYHFIGIEMFPDQWVEVSLGWSPDQTNSGTPYMGGQSYVNYNFPPNPEWPEPNTLSNGVITPVKYFDGFTRFYVSLDADGFVPYPYTCEIADFRFSTDAGQSPDSLVRNMAITYDPVGQLYEVGWTTSKFSLGTEFEIRMSQRSMKLNGFQSGELVWQGTQIRDEAVTAMHVQIPGALREEVFVAIRPQYSIDSIEGGSGSDVVIVLREVSPWQTGDDVHIANVGDGINGTWGITAGWDGSAWSPVSGRSAEDPGLFRFALPGTSGVELPAYTANTGQAMATETFREVSYSPKEAGEPVERGVSGGFSSR